MSWRITTPKPFLGDETEATAEICNQCGRSVKPGSGWFVNRVQSDFGSVEEAKDKHGTPYPEGAWQCSECANNVDIFHGACAFGRLEVLDLLASRLGRIPTPEETDACIEYIIGDADRLAEEFGTMVSERIAQWIADNR